MDIPKIEEFTPTLLYVEDDSLTQELVIRILRRKFPQISLILAQDGQEGLDLCAECRPEIILTDIRMPVLDGIKMAKRIKEMNMDAQIIVLSASNETHNILEAIDIGINNYVLKPIQTEKLIRSIEQCLDRLRLTEQLKQKEEYIRRMAYYDHLTGLPNRQLFREFLHKSIAHAERHKRILSVLFLDVDGFKNINDTLGHTVGDQLLKAIAERLKTCSCRDEDSVIRWGGDEFIILLPDLDEQKEAVTVAKKINQAFSQPISLPDHELSVSLSIGISFFPQDGIDEENLIRRADRSMYRAKATGKNQFCCCTDLPTVLPTSTPS